MHQAKFLLGLAVLAFANSLSHASISVVPTQPAVLPGYTAYGIFWDGGGTEDWIGSGIAVDLTQGMFYEDPFGGDGPSSSALIAIFPTLEFDTYFGIIGDATGGIFCALECFPPLPIGPTYIGGMQWYNTDSSNSGYVKIGNFTVSNDATGTWSILSAGIQTGGIILPEPTTLALLATACPPLLRRR